MNQSSGERFEVQIMHRSGTGPEKEAALKSLRVFRVSGFENMLIIYRPLPDGVDILRVVHGSRNLQALFRRRGEIES